MKLILPTVALLAGLSACATTGGSDARGWREIDALPQSVVLVDDGPAIREGDIVTYKIAYVWQAGDKDSRRWQVYEAVQSNCTNNLVRLGRRTRWAEDGSVQYQDDSPDWEGIAVGGIADIATKAKCEGKYPENPLVVRGNQDLVATARAWLLEQAD